MSLHHLKHNLTLLYFQVLHSDWKTMAGCIALLMVALLFLVVGISRWVEFKDFGFSKFRVAVFASLHVIGCIALSLAFAIVAVDLNKLYSDVGLGLLIAALILLFPAHIYIGLLRRIKNPPPNAAIKPFFSTLFRSKKN